ncbi:MAG: hypothetical protein K5681_01655 [Treponema sp.]|nr:hypothetical protein [Treponema sp.]
MQACKKLCGGIFPALIFSGLLFAESIEMPEMPQMPSMPTVSSSGSFYRPSLPSQISNKSSSQENSQSTESGSQTVLTETSSEQDLFSALLEDSSTLTASDISDLYDSGLFTTMSSLTGGSLSSTNLLQKTLTNLNTLKEEQKDLSLDKKEDLLNKQEDAQTFKSREPSILRFKINGYNITDSLTKVFFSDPEADGSFLLTGDRRYYVNQLPRTETFYMVFRTVSSSGSAVSYKVQPTVVQDSKNENSFVYKLGNAKNLTAEKTGNLVVMHFAEGDLKVEMLLDIDKK